MLRFIMGNSGSGKTRYLYEHVIQESMKHRDINYLVLVPEQFTMQTQKDFCMLHPNHGIMNIDVLSFGRMAHRIFEETGGNRAEILDDEGKNLILRKIATEIGDGLKVLGGNLKKQGYINEIKSVISEFTQYGVGTEQLDMLIGELEPESFLSYKLKDIRKVYEGFESFLEDRYITKEEILDVLSSVAGKSEILKNSVVVLDGFTGFTPVQNRLLGELMCICRDVIVTVEMDQREDAFRYTHPYQLFALSKQMVTGLTKMAQEKRVEIADPVRLYGQPVYRFRNNAELAFLEQEVFRYSRRQYEETPECISVLAARTPASEAVMAAEEIRRIVREKKIRYRDIAVICSNMDVYAHHLERACREYEIPVFMDYKKSILLNAFVEYIRSLLGMIEQDFSYQSVFRFLRTGLAGFARDEIDILENYVLALGIRGYKKWSSVWARKTKETEEAQLEMLNRFRLRFVEMTEALVHKLRKKQKTVKEITAEVYSFLLQNHIQEQLEMMEQKFQQEGRLALAKEYAQIYRIVLELFDKFVYLLGEENISLKEYCELLDAGIEEAKVGVIPPGMDQIMIGDMQRTRLKSNLKALFFIGANDTLLPGNLYAGGFLSERDREKFAEGKIALSPGAKEKTYIQKFYLYMNLTKPDTFLRLSYSKISEDGKSLRPAYLIQDIRKLFPKLEVLDEEGLRMQCRELNRKTGKVYLIRGIRDRHLGVDETWKELYSWYRRDPRMQEELEQILKAGFFRKEEETLSREEARKLYGETGHFSVTRMERFAACAYAHFLTYGLHLTDREKYEFEAMDLGNIAHQSMERFSRKVQEKKKTWMDLERTERDGLVEESVEESIKDYGNTVLYSTARNEYMIVRIKELIRRSVWALTKQMEKGDFLPSGYEWNFGSGKIDRIDTCEEEDVIYVKVTDYKTGMKSFDITALYHGLQMQLPVYLNAALKLERRRAGRKKVEPAGVFYYRIQNPIVEKEANEEKLEKKILKELKLDGIISSKEDVIEHLEHDLSGNSFLNPLGKNKDGSLSRFSKVLSPEEFDRMLKFTERKEAQIEAEIRSGAAEPNPYELNGSTGCDYCAYRDICGFDERLDGYAYRSLEALSREEAIGRMKEELMKEDSSGKGENGL